MNCERCGCRMWEEWEGVNNGEWHQPMQVGWKCWVCGFWCAIR